MEAQDSLAEAVQLAFSHLVDCLQEELANAMPAFLEESLRDLDADDGKIRTLKLLVLLAILFLLYQIVFCQQTYRAITLSIRFFSEALFLKLLVKICIVTG